MREHLSLYHKLNFPAIIFHCTEFVLFWGAPIFHLFLTFHGFKFLDFYVLEVRTVA
jgi:hypothetical protein